MTATIHKLSAGTGYEYLTRQVAVLDGSDKGRASLADYYSAKGEAPGRWVGRGLSSLSMAPRGITQEPADAAQARSLSLGDTVTEAQMKALFGEGRHPNADLIEQAHADAGASARTQLAASKLGARYRGYAGAGEFMQRLAIKLRDYNYSRGDAWDATIADDVRATLRTEVGHEMFVEKYGRPPADDRELSGFISQARRNNQRTAVAGYDVTFSPVKSVSTLWALGHAVHTQNDQIHVGRAIEAAHSAAVADALSFIEDHATFTRMGTDGVAQYDCEGLIATAFVHRDSRAGDPDLHTHVAIANKVRATDKSTGRTVWLALDGTPLFKAMVSASEVYNSRLETHLRDRLGVDFASIAHEDRTKRPTREIVGVPEELRSRWSERRAQIKDRQAELAAEFHAKHGREPTTPEALALAQQANLDTRAAKHAPRSLAEQVDEWRRQAIGVLGSDTALHTTVRSVLGRRDRSQRTHPLDAAEATALADTVLTTISETRSSWQLPHLRAEAERQLRGLGDTPGEAGYFTADTIAHAVHQVASRAIELSLPHQTGIPDGERAEPDMLRRHDGSSVYTRHDTALYTSADIVAAEQRIVAAARLDNGRRIDELHVELALLELEVNGTALNAGQATMVRELATSGRRVQVALAPAGTGKTWAMRALGEAWSDSGGRVVGLAPTAAAAAVLHDDLGTDTDTLAKLVHLIEHSATPTSPPPQWFTDLGPDSLVIIDEAGMASTRELDVAIAHLVAVGASVRLVGDDQQLASVSAGGVVRDVAHETGALSLSQVMRFSDTAEGAASLALRDGDPAALAYLADNHRIHVAPDVVAADQAYNAWVADRRAGHDAVMLAATRETTRALNERARNDRIARLPSTAVPRPEATLADGLTASVGDIIATRRNNRALRASTTDFVRNGDRWTVTAVSDRGSLTVQNLDHGRILTLPADYVREHVTLGYASTIHAAQGMTADRCHVVGSDQLTRQLLYVALTRGKHSNHIYLSTAEDDPHRVLTPKAVTPATAIEVLETVLARDEAQKSATTALREASAPTGRLAPAAAMYADAMGRLAAAHIGEKAISDIENAAEEIHPGLTDMQAWPVLLHHLITHQLGGADACALLKDIYDAREIDTADDLAAVLLWRLPRLPQRDTSPLPWLIPIPPGLDADRRDYSQRRADLVGDLASQVRADAEAWTADSAPSWARPLVVAGVSGTIVGQLAVFRAAQNVPDTDPRPTGPAAHTPATRDWQHHLDELCANARIGAGLGQWDVAADALDPLIVEDPYWPHIAVRLDTLARAGLDVATLMRSAAAEGPLPTELPAGALWWRMTRDLDPSVLDPADTAPAWCDAVSAVCGEALADVIVRDTAWPALISAVNAATAWEPHTILATAHESLIAAQEPDESINPGEYTRALAWRIDALIAGDRQLAEEHSDASTAHDAPLTAEEEEELEHLDHSVDHHTTGGTDRSATTAHGAPILDDADWFLSSQRTGQHHRSESDEVVALGDAVALHYELRAQIAEADESIAALWSQITSNSAPHQKAADATLIATRAVVDAQRPAVAAVTTAREWLDATRVDLAALTDQDTRLRERLDDLSGQQADESRRLDEEYQTPADERLSIELERTILGHQIAGRQDEIAQAEHAVAAAETELAAVVATTGGRLVSEAEASAIQRVAQELDSADLADLRTHRDTLRARLWRCEATLGRRTMLRLVATDHGPNMAEIEQASAITTLVELFAENPLQAMSHTELAERIDDARANVRRAQADLAITRRPDDDRESRVRAAHARADEHIEAISVAREAMAGLRRAEQLVAAAQQAVTEHLATTPSKKSHMAAYQDRARTLGAALTRARTVRTELTMRAQDARRGVEVPESEWDALIASSTDPAHRQREIDQARRLDRAASARRTHAADTLRSGDRDLSTLLNELARRDSLHPDAGHAEDTARARITQQSPIPTPPPRPTTDVAPTSGRVHDDLTSTSTVDPTGITR